MTDIMTPEQRHRCMAAIRGKDTKPEMIVRRFLHSHGFRYGLHNKKLPGCPDIVMRKYKTVIFIHGCFWHGHEGCKFSRLPHSNKEFWDDKITKNRHRDTFSIKQLEKKGWRVITIWECELKNKEKREKTLENLLMQIRNGQHLKEYIPEQEIGIAAESENPYGE